jgi:hypothetical protein
VPTWKDFALIKWYLRGKKNKIKLSMCFAVFSLPTGYNPNINACNAAGQKQKQE